MKRLAILFSLFLSVFMATADEKGESIAKRYFDKSGATDTYGTATMTIIDSSKNSKVRVLEMYGRKATERGDVLDSFIRFLEPADIRNTKFLTLGNAKGDDDQRLYLPATKSIRKIASSGNDGKFMGSDVFYYDLGSKRLEDFTFTYKEENAEIANKAFAGRKFYVLEQVAKDKNAPYGKAVVWIDMADDFLYKTDAYDKSGKLWKTMYILKVKTVDGIIVPTDTLVVNYKDNSKTRLELKDVVINKGVPDSVFTIQNLEK